MEINEVKQKIVDFLESDSKYYLSEKKIQKIDFVEILNFDFELAEYVINNPDDTIYLFRNILSEKNGRMTFVSFYNVSKIPTYRKRIRDLRAGDLEKLVAIKGVIRNISNVFVELNSITFSCGSCGKELKVNQKRFFDKITPKKCSCNYSKWVEVNCERRDCQKVVIEEELDSIEGVQIPEKIEAYLIEDLAQIDIEKFNNLGSRVEIVGIVKERHTAQQNMYTKYLKVTSITHLDEKYKDIQISDSEKQKIIELSQDKTLMDKMVNSFARHIYGLTEIKKAMILQLYGSIEKNKSETNQKYERGNFHILVVGDPATAKTQLIKSIEDIALKTKYATGITSTKAGITVSVIKDETTGGFALQAGAVLLANNGIAILDEFDKMNDEDRLALHECMSEQSISVDKASIHTKLVCKTSILASANWKHSRFDPTQNVYSQINMADSLISRFDLIFIIRDIPHVERDTHMAKLVIGNLEFGKPEIDYELWKKHIVYCKSFNPKINDELQKKMMDFFIQMRNKSASQTEKFVNITLRQAEAIKRLSIASARLHLRDVTEEDFNIAKNLLVHSLKEVAFDSMTGKIDVDIIETGTSTSEKSLLMNLREFIKEQSIKFGDVGFEIIHQKFNNIDESQLESLLEKLSIAGDIYEPKPARFKIID